MTLQDRSTNDGEQVGEERTNPHLTPGSGIVSRTEAMKTNINSNGATGSSGTTCHLHDTDSIICNKPTNSNISPNTSNSNSPKGSNDIRNYFQQPPKQNKLIDHGKLTDPSLVALRPAIYCFNANTDTSSVVPLSPKVLIVKGKIKQTGEWPIDHNQTRANDQGRSTVVLKNLPDDLPEPQLNMALGDSETNKEPYPLTENVAITKINCISSEPRSGSLAGPRLSIKTGKEEVDKLFHPNKLSDLGQEESTINSNAHLLLWESSLAPQRIENHLALIIEALISMGNVALMHADKLDIQINILQSVANSISGVDSKLEHLNSLIRRAQADTEVTMKPLDCGCSPILQSLEKLSEIINTLITDLKHEVNKTKSNSCPPKPLQRTGIKTPHKETKNMPPTLRLVEDSTNKPTLTNSQSTLYLNQCSKVTQKSLDQTEETAFLWATASTVSSDGRPLPCELSLPNLETYSREGDVVFGILASVHEETVYPSIKSLFTGPPSPRRCERIHSEFYQSVLAMVFAISEINSSPDLLPNTTLGFHIYDSCSSELGAIQGTLQQLSGGKETIPNYSRPSSPKLVGFIGDGPSPETLPMARILGLSRFPQISYVAALPILSDKILFPSFLRTVTSAIFQVDGLMQMLLLFGWTWIGILISNNDHGLQGSQMLREEAAKNDICIEFFETLPTQSSRTSLAHAIDTVQRSTARVVVCYTYVIDIAPFLKEISLQWIPEKIWIGIPSWVPSKVFSWRDMWHTLNGTLGLAVHSGDIPGLKEFLYNIHPHRDTKDIFMKTFWEQAFSCKWMNTFNGTKSGEKEGEQALCSGTEKLESLDASVLEVNDFRYPFSAYQAIYALAQALHDLLHCKDKEGPFAKGSCADPMNFQPWQMLHYVKNARMRSSAGSELYFDASGDFRSVLDLLYWHITSNETRRFVKVGTYDVSAPKGLRLVIDKNVSLWGGKGTQTPQSVCSESCDPGYRKSTIKGRPKCCFSCMPCPDGSITSQADSLECLKCPIHQWSSKEKDRCIGKKIDFLSYEEPLGFTLALISIFLFFNAVAILGTFVSYHHTPVVRANNLHLSYILLLALMMCFLCPLIFIGQPGRWTCMVRQVIFGISFSLAVSCVMAKTVMVVIAFRATKPDSKLRRWIGSRLSYINVLVCTFIEVTIGVIWLGTSPGFPELTNSTDNWKITVLCNEGSNLMFCCMLVFIGILACVSFGIAFLARNLPDNFNEAKFITFSMLVFVSVWISFIPAYLSTKGKYLVAVEIFAILSSGAGLMYCIFAPKIYIIFLKPEMNTKEFLVKKATTSMCTG
ncbi:vomeronasal type-2 receptor 1-like [Lissotriton helveticus]